MADEDPLERITSRDAVAIIAAVGVGIGIYEGMSIMQNWTTKFSKDGKQPTAEDVIDKLPLPETIKNAIEAFTNPIGKGIEEGKTIAEKTPEYNPLTGVYWGKKIGGAIFD